MAPLFLPLAYPLGIKGFFLQLSSLLVCWRSSLFIGLFPVAFQPVGLLEILDCWFSPAYWFAGNSLLGRLLVRQWSVWECWSFVYQVLPLRRQKDSLEIWVKVAFAVGSLGDGLFFLWSTGELMGFPGIWFLAVCWGWIFGPLDWYPLGEIDGPFLSWPFSLFGYPLGNKGAFLSLSVFFFSSFLLVEELDSLTG